MREIIGLVLCGLLMAGSARAADCGLKQYDAIDMRVTPDGVTLPVSFGDVHKAFSLNLGNVSNYMSGELAEVLGLHSKALPEGISFAAGDQQITRYTTASNFRVGKIAPHEVQFLVLTPEANSDHIDGSIGTSLLLKADLELDFAQEKLNLFSSDHCPGRVVHWTRTGYAQLPFVRDPAGYLRIEMQLDGKPVRAALASDGVSRIGMNDMRRLFGIDAASPGMVPVESGARGEKFYRYEFKNLTADGLTIANPSILVVDEPKAGQCREDLHFAPDTLPPGAVGSVRTEKCFGSYDVTLGLSVLSKLHLYIASKEQMLYFTSAAAR